MSLEWSDVVGSQEIDGLYRRLAWRLQQMVRVDVHAPDPLIEDACQTAWGRLIDHCDHVRRETALAWLATTAVHEAFRLLRRGRREVSLEAMLEGPGEWSIPAAASTGPHELVEQREQIAKLAELPPRQRRLVCLQALGLSYAELAARERCTTRTVDRQLLRARDELRRRAG